MSTTEKTEKVDSEITDLKVEDQGANGKSVDVESKTKDVSIGFCMCIQVLD